MKFYVNFASDDHKPFEVEISSLEELQKLSKTYNHDIILQFKGVGNQIVNQENEITVYDSWIE